MARITAATARCCVRAAAGLVMSSARAI
jgi:hypothetical protein